MKIAILIGLTFLLMGCYSNINKKVKVRTQDFELGTSSKTVSNEYSTGILSQTYSTEMTETLIELSKEVNKIFRDLDYTIDKESTTNTRKNASLLISINETQMDISFLEKKILSLAVQNNWKYKGKYGSNYIFCNNLQDLLEISPPLGFLKNPQDGYGLVPQENIWNIGIFARVGGVKICLDRYDKTYE